MTEPRRPSFPAQLGVPPRARRTVALAASSAIKEIASRPGNYSAGAPKPLQITEGSRAVTDPAAVRHRMVARLQSGGIEHPGVLSAMASVQRHRFVDSGLLGQAYEDTSLPIGLGQTISKPSIVARMVQLLLQSEAVRNGVGLGRVLEIGTGCGYQAAVLAQVAREVYSIERLRGLHEKARDNLRPFRLANLHLLLGDGMLGYARGAPYAAIIAAAGGDAIPEAWCEQLAIGGRLVAPMAVAGTAGRQVLVVVDKTSRGLEQRILEDVLFVPLKSGIV